MPKPVFYFARMSKKIKIKSRLETTNSTPAWHIVRFPKTKVASLKFERNLRRVVCSLNGSEKMHCALFLAGDDYFITVSKKLRDTLGLNVGEPVTVEMEKDESKYGMPMPKEFAEVLKQDSEGKKVFEALSPGNQRLMLKLVVFVKESDKRIVRSLVGVEILKQTKGKFDYHLLHDAMRAAMKPLPHSGVNDRTADQ